MSARIQVPEDSTHQRLQIQKWMCTHVLEDTTHQRLRIAASQVLKPQL